MESRFARRMDGLRASEIRELLKVTERPEVISLAGGLPAAELFPVEELKAVALRVLEEHGRSAMQYSTTEGHLPLRAWIARRMTERLGATTNVDDVLITSGSQQAIDLTGKLFLDEGDVVLCESPTYLGALNAFRAYQPRFMEVPTDDEGMIVSELERRLHARSSRSTCWRSRAAISTPRPSRRWRSRRTFRCSTSTRTCDGSARSIAPGATP